MIFRSKVENQIPLRNALARFFGILERSGRYLTLGYKIQWPLAMFLGKLFEWFEKIKGKQSLSVVTPASSIVFFQDSDPSLSIEPRGHGVYPWSPDAHRDVPKVPRAVCFFGQLLLLSMQSPVKDGFRLEA